MATIKVKLKNGETVPMSHPDDWSQEQIESAIHESFPDEEESESAQPKERTGLLGVGSDVAHGLSNALKGGLKFAHDIPEMTEDLGGELLNNPGTGQVRGLAQIGAEAAEIGKGLINAPYNLNQYLARKHLLPGVLGKIGKLIPHLPEDTGVEKALGLTPGKGGRILRGLTEGGALLAGGAPIVKGIKKAVTAPSKARLFKRALENKIDQVATEKGLATGDLDKLKESLRDEYSRIHGERLGELTPIGQQESINIKKIELEANPKKNEVPEGELPKPPEKPDTKAMLEEHQKAIDEAKDAAEKGLDILNNPSIKAGGKIKKAIQNLHSKSSGLYKSARNHYIDQKITADNSKEIKAVTQDLETLKDADELAPGYGSGTPEQKALESNIAALKGEKVQASDIFDLQRTLEKMADDTRKKQYSGVNELDFKRLGNLAERLDNHAEKLATRLETVGGKDVQKMIQEANKGWKTYKQLIKDNPVGKAAMKGSVPNQALIRLAEDHPANDFLKGLVDSDAELRKYLLAAYSGEKNVNKLLKPSSVIKNYIESLPDVEEKINAFKNALSEYKSGEKSSDKINKAHDDLVRSMKEVAEAKQLQQQIKFHEETIPKVKEKMKLVDAKSAEHDKLSRELKAHEQHLADKNHLLKKYGKRVVGFLGINEVAKKLGF